jgi:SAM-dependent methyltransferase
MNESGDWFDAPQGRHVLESERALMDAALAELFGFVMVQLGDWGPRGALVGARRTPQLVIAAAGGEAAEGTVRCDPAALPFASDSVDVLVLPHTLEASRRPQAVMRECERVLVGEGHLVVLGFNPFSAWGARRRVGPQRFPFDLPNCITEQRLGDWLALLGLETLSVQRHLHGLPFESAAGLRRGAWLERAGRDWWPGLAGGYVLTARKRRFGATKLRLADGRAARVYGGVEPAVRRAAA